MPEDIPRPGEHHEGDIVHEDGSPATGALFGPHEVRYEKLKYTPTELKETYDLETVYGLQGYIRSLEAELATHNKIIPTRRALLDDVKRNIVKADQQLIKNLEDQIANGASREKLLREKITQAKLRIDQIQGLK